MFVIQLKRMIVSVINVYLRYGEQVYFFLVFIFGVVFCVVCG